jgi:uncharacterized protein YndB with AHSA1/START domain
MISSIVSTPADEPVILIERTFDAPRTLVFKLITDPFHLAQFHGPHGVTNTISEMDVRPGGYWRQVMHFPDGSAYSLTSVYLEVAEPERLVYRDAPHGSACELADLPPALLVTSFVFDDLGGKTKLRAQARVTSFAARLGAMGFADAMCQGNEKLAAYLTTL